MSGTIKYGIYILEGGAKVPIYKGSIEPGMLVGLKKTHEEKETKDFLLKVTKCHGRGPFKVVRKPDAKHVTLEYVFGEQKGAVVQMGSTACPLVHIDLLEPWRP